MVKCVAAFLNFCYLVRRNAICADTLEKAGDALRRFHEHREVFVRVGVRPNKISLPRQHSLKHYIRSIRLFGSPNGLCSSITESKHIPAVKKPWRRSNRYNALSQMLRTNQRMDKMHALRRILAEEKRLDGSTLSYTARMLSGEEPELEPPTSAVENEDDTNDHGAVRGQRFSLSVTLATREGIVFGISHSQFSFSFHLLFITVHRTHIPKVPVGHCKAYRSTQAPRASQTLPV